MEERVLSRIKPYNKTISKIKIQNIKYKKGNKYSNKITYNLQMIINYIYVLLLYNLLGQVMLRPEEFYEINFDNSDSANDLPRR